MRSFAVAVAWSALVAVFASGCSQAFRFTEDAGRLPDAGSDAGTDAGPADGGGPDGGGYDGGACQLPGECECDADAGCGGVRPRCGADHRCVECTAHADCGVNGLCDPKTRRCTTACTATSQCTLDTRTVCGFDLPRHCIACDDPPSCSGALPFCAESVGYCVVCVSDSHCSAPTPRCDKRGGTCVQCLTGADCQATEYCAVTTGTCRARP